MMRGGGEKQKRKPIMGKLFTTPNKAIEDATAAVKKEANKHLFQKIFAVPIHKNQVDDFVPPVFSKTYDEKQFLRNVLSENFIFSDLSMQEIDTLVDAFEKYATASKTNQCLIREGDLEADYFYILYKGSIEYKVNDVVVGTDDKPGSCFGELALLYKAPRAASVYVTSSWSELFRLDQQTFRQVLQSKTQNADQKRLDLLKSVPVFQNVDPNVLLKLARTMQERHYKEGEYLCRKGESCETSQMLWIIQEGQVKATDITIGGSKYEDQTFGVGETIGWRSIQNNKEPTIANMLAIGTVKVLVIDSKTFKDALGDVKQFVNKLNDKRMLKSVTAFRDSGLDDTIISALVDMIYEDYYPQNFAICEERTETEAALYLVREGQVTIESADGYYNKTVTSGGYFGEDLLLADHQLLGSGPAKVESKYTVTTAPDVECTAVGVLKLQDIRKLLNTTVLGLGGKDPTFSPLDTSIKIDDLTRHVMLGAGSFGQVWLASAPPKQDEGTRPTYALKVQSKYQLIKTYQAEGVVSEKNIMASLCSDFILQLVNTYQDEQRVYMLTGLLQGGELATVLHNAEYNGIGEDNAKFYAAGILEGLTFMHRRKIIHRDIKPQNVMINAKGYPVLIDFGFAKYVPDKTFTFCGTPIYLAPEVIRYYGHDKGADHWSLACMIYEMCEGDSPFWEAGMEELDLFKKIVRGRFEVRGWMSVDLKTLLVSMLVPRPSDRLGSLAGGSKDIYEASWFSDIDFDKIRLQEIEAPWVPESKDPLDSSNFYDISKHVEDKFEADEPELTPEEHEVFKTF